MKKQLFQCHIRSWETMEYAAPVYVMAESDDEAYELMEEFRPTHQCKSIIPEGRWIPEDDSDWFDERFDRSFIMDDNGYRQVEFNFNAQDKALINIQ